ncbi:SpoIIIAH-like family protein [Bacillus sp. JCM 19041]|uniref:SpoIIIAH-like family protein n=1 Tax=Bacillus sp. JCM 19041 TaxID=1460637 RepID=UPI000ABF2DD8
MTGARIKREEQRSREVEELQREASNEENSAEEKVEANDKSIEILAFTNNEKELESLLKEQGYSDAFVFSQDQNNVQIMVQANELSNDEALAIMATAREKLELNDRAEVSVKFEPIEE